MPNINENEDERNKVPMKKIDYDKEICKHFFEGNHALINLQGNLLRKVGNGQYMFSHKSCEEYFAAEKIINQIVTFNFQNLKKSGNLFAKEIHTFSLDKKLINEEISIIRFIADRIHQQGAFENSK